MIDAKQLLDKFMGSGMAGGLAGGLAGGALTGLLTSKKGREIAGSALKIGGVALAGGLAYKAYQNYRDKQSLNASQASHSEVTGVIDKNAFIPPGDDTVAQQSLGLLLLKAMISAAKADGNIDTQESSKIFSEINRLGLEAEEKALLMEEYGQPVDIPLLVADVKTPEQAIEVYAASVLIINEQNPQEARYLHSLSTSLGLDPALVEEIHQAVATDLSTSNQQERVA